MGEEEATMREAICSIPNCGRTAPAAEPFCARHRAKEDRYESALRTIVELRDQGGMNANYAHTMAVIAENALEGRA